MQDESLFRQEAWRYQLEEDGTLSLTGTVYNEMQGSYTLSSASSFNNLSAAFPGSTAGNVSGGKPDEITGMTWQELKDYHDKYYHPSNSLTMVYGKLEQPEAFLALLDGYFAEYEARDFSDAFPDAGYTPLTESTEAVYDYPAEAGADTTHASQILYSYVCTGATLQDELVCDLLTTLLNAESSPMMQALKEQLPHATVTSYYNNMGPELLMTFSATGVDETDAELLRQIVNTALAQVAENGFDADLTESIAAAYGLSTRLALESSSLGVDLLPSFAMCWALDGDLYALPASYEALDSIVTWNTDGTYQDFLRRFTGEGAVTVTSITRPVPGLKEEQDAALAARLAEVKAGMTDAELADIAAWTEAGTVATTTDLVAELTAVTVDSLPEETRLYDIDDVTGEDGVRRIHVQAAADGVGYSTLRMNAGGLDEEQLLWCRLYISLLCEVGTPSHTSAQLSDLLNRYTGSVSVRISLPNEDNEYGYTPYLSVSYYALDENLLPAARLMRELLFESDFTQTDVISGRVSAYRTQLKQAINSAGYQVELYRMMGAVSPAYAMYAHINFTDYYDFLTRVEGLLSTDPESVTAGLNAVRDYFLATGGTAISAYVGSDEGNTLNAAAANAFLEGLDSQPVVRQACQLNTISAADALAVQTNTAFNLYFASWQELGLDDGYTADWDALCTLLNDRYLMPILRDGCGAYGAYAMAMDDGLLLYTYRDPNVSESFDTFFSLGSLLRADGDITQETLNGYILSAYSDLAASSG